MINIINQIVLENTFHGLDFVIAYGSNTYSQTDVSLHDVYFYDYLLDKRDTFEFGHINAGNLGG